MKNLGKKIIGAFWEEAKSFITLTGKTFFRPELAIGEVGKHPLYGVAGYTLLAVLMMFLVSMIGESAGFIQSADHRDLATASIVVFPFFLLIPLGFVHLNATVMKMGGSFWGLYNRALWAVYIWFVATAIAGVVVSILGMWLPIKLLGFFAFLPNFFFLVLLYLSLKVTNELPHWKAMSIWSLTIGLFALAVFLIERPTV